MNKLSLASLIFLTLTTSSSAGTPESDPYIRNYQKKFLEGIIPTPDQLEISRKGKKALPHTWYCREYLAKGINHISYHGSGYFLMRLVLEDGFVGNMNSDQFSKFTYESDSSSENRLYGVSKNSEQAAYIRLIKPGQIIIEIINLKHGPQFDFSSASVSDPARELESYVECRYKRVDLMNSFPICNLF
jgi:hypothetical protein